MFEDYSYDNLLAEMLSNVATDVDKREGSIIFDTLSQGINCSSFNFTIFLFNFIYNLIYYFLSTHK